MADNSAYLAFLRAPDQDVRRAELSTFFGPHAETFLRTYDRMQEDAVRAAGSRPRFSLFRGGFEVAAFFLGPVWFFYRKMWVIAWVIVAALAVLAFIPVLSRAGVALSVVLAMMAHRVYVQHAIGTLEKMRRADGTLDPEAMRAAGGVSKPAGTISGVIFGLLWVATIIGLVYLAKHGIAPQ